MHDFCCSLGTFKRILHTYTPSTMNKFQELETTALVEMLANHTTHLTAMLVKTVSSKEYEACKKIIEELQLELNLRFNSADRSRGTQYDPIIQD